MVAAQNQVGGPFSLVVTGEAEVWRRALETIIGPQWLRTHEVQGDRELLEVVQSGQVDAAVLDEDANWAVDVMALLRQIRRLNTMLPVVVVTRRTDRHWLETALALTAFSVVAKPLELEELLRQIRRMMIRLDRMLRTGPP